MSLLICCLLLVVSYLSINTQLSDNAKTGGIAVSCVVILLSLIL